MKPLFASIVLFTTASFSMDTTPSLKHWLSCAGKIALQINPQVLSPLSADSNERPNVWDASPSGEIVLLGISEEDSSPHRAAIFHPITGKLFNAKLNSNPILGGKLHNQTAVFFGRHTATITDLSGNFIQALKAPSGRNITSQSISEDDHVLGLDDGSLYSKRWGMTESLFPFSKAPIENMVETANGRTLIALGRHELVVFSKVTRNVEKRIKVSDATLWGLDVDEAEFQTKEIVLSPNEKSVLVFVKGFVRTGRRSLPRWAVVQFFLETGNSPQIVEGDAKGMGQLARLKTFLGDRKPWGLVSSSNPNDAEARAVVFPLSESGLKRSFRTDDMLGIPANELALAVSPDGKSLALPSREGRIHIVDENLLVQSIQFSTTPVRIAHMNFFEQDGKLKLLILSRSGERFEAEIRHP